MAPGITFGSSADKLVRVCFAASEKDLEEGIAKVCELIREHEHIGH